MKFDPAHPLTPRWTPQKPHAVQRALFTDPARFKIAHAGRRSGKTEDRKRFAIYSCLSETEVDAYRVVLAAPTWQQAKKIFWKDAKKLSPSWAVESISESELTIEYWNGARLELSGMDKPERVEGSPLDGIVLDEFGNMQADTFSAHVRPALSTPGRRPGWASFIGVPEGRNHYWELVLEARRRQAAGDPNWRVYHWPSWDIVDAEEVAEARRTLDELTFRQEYGGEFISFAGRAYWAFDSDVHLRPVRYSPAASLALCFDFNREPGVCAYVQELPCHLGGKYAPMVTAVVGEVWIPRGSNTVRVCERIASDWGGEDGHRGEVLVYGDATGGAGGSAKVLGSDWDLVKRVLRPVFGDRLKMRVPDENPRERARVNAVNSRLRAADGTIRMLVDPEMAQHAAADLDSVQVVEGGSGEIDKPTKGEESKLTHMSDAIGYYVAKRWPVAGGGPPHAAPME